MIALCTEIIINKNNLRFFSAAMAVCVHLLLLLVPVLSLCEATQYYVTPTEPTNTSCPAQPCHTLNHYTKHSELYFKSNTVFKFLPGTHLMNRSLKIRDVENITLETSDDNSDMLPELVAQSTSQCVENSDCIDILHFRFDYIVCCSVIWMINVTHASIEGISVIVRRPKVTGVILQQCSHLHIQSISYTIIQGHNLFQQIGIIALESKDIDMDSLEASNFAFGMVLYKSTNTNMMNVFAADNKHSGIYLIDSTDTNMTNVFAAHNEGDGIYLLRSANTNMMNVSATLNGNGGIILYTSTNTNMMNVFAAHNQDNGIYLIVSTNTNMMNVSDAHNGGDGICLYRSANTNMMNVSNAHNGNGGIILIYCTVTNMVNVFAAHNEDNGIYLVDSTDTNMTNVIAAHNGGDGICLYRSANTNMMNVSNAHNGNGGIILIYCTVTNMVNVFAAHNEDNGIYLVDSTDTNMTNVIAAHNGGDGIYLSRSANTNMMNVSAALNQINAITMSLCLNTILYYSYTNTMHIRRSTDTYITNTSSIITAYNSKQIILNDTLFSNMYAPSIARSSSEPTCLPAVISLYNSTLYITDCKFTRNIISSIKTIGSNVTMSGKVLFHNNTASSGTVLISAKNSLLITTDYSNIRFLNNHALNYGGVFYITTEESYETSMSLQDIFQNYHSFNQGGGSLIISRTECFVRVEGSRSHARLTFINNTAGRGGDVLYGGLVSLGYDGDWNCLLSFKNISDISQQSGLSLISSAPSRVCLCNYTGQPDCLTVADPTTRVMYPGQTITIPAVVVGQDFGTVTGSVIAQILHTTDSVYMGQKQDSIAVEHRQCSNLEYTIFSQIEESAAMLVLTNDKREISRLKNEEDNQEITNSWEILNKELNYKTLAQHILCDFIERTIVHHESNQPDSHTIEDFYKFTNANFFNYSCKSEFIQTKFVFPKEIYSYPTYINISFRPCPPGFSLSKDPPFRCDCNQLMKQLPGVTCHIQDQTISRSGLVWISTDGNETMAASNCPYNYCNRKGINITLEDPDSQCNYNHSGTLCGGCQPGLSLALGTNQCMHCPNTHLALLLPFALAGVVLVCFIKAIDLTISQGTLCGLIFYANVVKANEYLLYNEKTYKSSCRFHCMAQPRLGNRDLLFQWPDCLWEDVATIRVSSLHLDHCKSDHHTSQVQ